MALDVKRIETLAKGLRDNLGNYLSGVITRASKVPKTYKNEMQSYLPGKKTAIGFASLFAVAAIGPVVVKGLKNLFGIKSEETRQTDQWAKYEAHRAEILAEREYRRNEVARRMKETGAGNPEHHNKEYWRETAGVGQGSTTRY